MQTEIADPQFLVACTFPEKLGTGDVKNPARDQNIATRVQVRIRKIDTQDFVSPVRIGAEKKRTLLFDPQVGERKKSGALMEYALFSEPIRTDVAVVIEESECIPALEDKGAVIGE